jgi:hypothetical protein
VALFPVVHELLVLVIVVIFAIVEDGVHVFLDDDVLDMKECGTIERDVDERGLHAGKHARDLTEVHVSHGALVLLTLDE